MSKFKLESHGENDIHVLLEVESVGAVDTAFGSHLLKDAIVHLIEEADFDFWEKHQGELTPGKFWAAILGAVGRSFRRSIPDHKENYEQIPALLHELIDSLAENEEL